MSLSGVVRSVTGSWDGETQPDRNKNGMAFHLWFYSVSLFFFVVLSLFNNNELDY